MAQTPEQSIDPDSLEEQINTETASRQESEHRNVVKEALKSAGVKPFDDGQFNDDQKGEELAPPTDTSIPKKKFGEGVFDDGGNLVDPSKFEKDARVPRQTPDSSDERNKTLEMGYKITKKAEKPTTKEPKEKPAYTPPSVEDLQNKAEFLPTDEKVRKLGPSLEEKQGLRLFKFAQENPKISSPISKKGALYVRDKINASNLSDEEKSDYLAVLDNMKIANPDAKSLKELVEQAKLRQENQEEASPQKSPEEIMQDLKARSEEEKEIHKKKVTEAIENRKSVKALKADIDQVRSSLQEDKKSIDESRSQIEQRLEERKPEEEYGDNFTVTGRIKSGLKKIGKFFGFGRKK